MYNSPIELFYNECNDLHTKLIVEQEKVVMKAVLQYGVNVNKEELIKALQYDRNQYNAGYHDGLKDGYEKAVSDIINKIRGNENV